MADGLGNELLATCFLSTARWLATMTLQFLAAAADGINNFRAADDSGSSTEDPAPTHKNGTPTGCLKLCDFNCYMAIATLLNTWH